MSREWKSGDVAMVRAEWHRDSAHAEHAAVRYIDGWQDFDGAYVYNSAVSDVRPLVVIDPEDREQVERLADLLAWALHTNDTPRLADALREFADPKPRIEEPTGLGAVVLDVDGSLLVRISRDEQRPWRAEGGHRFDWSEIDAVGELSPGTEPLADWELDLLRGAS